MVRIDVELDVPVQEAFDYFADFRNENEWNVVAHDVVMTTDIPVGAGSCFKGEYDRMGTLAYEILEYDRPRHLRVRGTSKSFDFVSTFDFSGSGGSTLMRGTMDPHPKGVMKVLTPLMGGVIKRQTTKGMASLRKVLESKPRPAAGAAAAARD